MFLSHLHADHCLDLCGYYVMRKYHPTGPQPQIPVWGPAGTAERMARAYDLPLDPNEMRNVAGEAAYEEVRADLSDRLERYDGDRDVFAEYRIDEQSISVVPGSGLGILRQTESGPVSRSFAELPPGVRRLARTPKLLNLTKRITDLLAITKLLTVFDTYDNEAEAVKSYK